ncbi:myelin protein zero-like protein 2 [Denticeps clupeoides]|uniref:myelin protein zero-like protein 2 n=1 Tax=Denticeps clupeoides TaxID=299321 RepID=UPI0010A3FB4B|nr:myelin protein zero-like protein 2 [Denticeps clupeoides]XP_028856593.1 myelin protein zero-like protein 2 [Denticeps clupeoides]
MGANRLQLLLVLLLLGLASSVRAMRVYTSGEVEAVNGTDARLKCTFKSSHTIQPSSVTVTWTFRPLSSGDEESVFYYHTRPYPPTEGRFQNKVVWAGDITGRDASITVRQVKFIYNGTFTCQVKNPPDVHGNLGTVRLKVVTTASMSDIVILACAVVGSIVLVMIVLGVLVWTRTCRLGRGRGDEGAVHRDEKDISMW